MSRLIYLATLVGVVYIMLRPVIAQLQTVANIIN